MRQLYLGQVSFFLEELGNNPLISHMDPVNGGFNVLPHEECLLIKSFYGGPPRYVLQTEAYVSETTLARYVPQVLVTEWKT